MQVGIFKVEIEHDNKQTTCKFFVVPGIWHALLGMPHIDTLNIRDSVKVIKTFARNMGLMYI